MLYGDISSFQPMEIYVDDEAKLTLHGLVQVEFNFPRAVCGLLNYYFAYLVVLHGSTTSN